MFYQILLMVNLLLQNIRLQRPMWFMDVFIARCFGRWHYPFISSQVVPQILSNTDSNGIKWFHSHLKFEENESVKYLHSEQV